MKIRSSKNLLLGFIIIFTVSVSVVMPLSQGLIPSFELVGSALFYALIIGGVPFIIYHFIIGDRKKKIEKN